MIDNAHPELDRFRKAAEKFIQIVDSVSAYEREGFMASLSHSLADLYSSALDLSAVEPDSNGINETPSPAEESAELCRSLKNKIGQLDSYWKIFDSTENGAAVQASLSGDISEIYFDLKHDLQLVSASSSHADALWELRFSFRSHWGKHLLGALAAIHDRHVE